MNENIPSQKRPNFSSLNGIHKPNTANNNVRGGAGKKLVIKNRRGMIDVNFSLHLLVPINPINISR